MNRSPIKSATPGRLLASTKNLYLVVVVALAQLAPNLFAIPAAFLIQNNAEFTKSQFTTAARFALFVILLGNIILLFWIHFYYRTPRLRLVQWLKGEPLSIDAHEETRAWELITNLPWRYGLASVVVSIFIDILPLMGFLYFYEKATPEQLIYTLIGGIISAAIIIILGILLIERLLAPAREILLPKSFETQLAGVTGTRVLTKFQVIITFLILVSALLIAPIGYHLTRTVLMGGLISPSGVLVDLRIQSVVAGAVAVFIGFVVTFLLARSVSDPIRRLINVFNKVESGDLKQRAMVTASDEVGELTVYFNRMISRLDELQENLERQVAARTQQLKTTLEVGRAASSILNTGELITKTVNLITERFGYYYAALFLLDDSGRWAELKDATGIAGQTLKSQGHRLEVGGKSMVGTAINSGQARIALDVGEEPVRFNNPLLPETRSEIALPLMIGDRVIGALDVQSKDEAAFGEAEISTLQGMADQVAIALENAHLFQQTQNSLEELRASQHMQMTMAWSEMAKERSGFEYITSGQQLEAGKETASLIVPLTLREQIIGQLSLEGSQSWSPEERSLVEAVATQTALALENARLLEESQQLALRERLIAEITGKVWSSPNVDIILQTAIKELSRAMRADLGTIELKLD